MDRYTYSDSLWYALKFSILYVDFDRCLRFFQIDSHQRIFERPIKVKFEQQTYFIPRVFSSKIL